MQQKGRSRYKAANAENERRKKQLRSWGIAVTAVLLIVCAVLVIRHLGGSGQVSVNTLPCTADQSITVFGDGILYYDGVSIHAVSGSGAIRWSFAVGSNA